MEVPNFADLGQNARDVFKTGYHHGKGLIKFNVKTKSAKRFQMMSDTTLNFEASKVVDAHYVLIQIDLKSLTKEINFPLFYLRTINSMT